MLRGGTLEWWLGGKTQSRREQIEEVSWWKAGSWTPPLLSLPVCCLTYDAFYCVMLEQELQAE